jgi:hypothetical protein
MTQSYDMQRIDFRGEFPEGLHCVDRNVSRYENLRFESQTESGEISTMELQTEILYISDPF